MLNDNPESFHHDQHATRIEPKEMDQSNDVPPFSACNSFPEEHGENLDREAALPKTSPAGESPSQPQPEDSHLAGNDETVDIHNEVVQGDAFDSSPHAVNALSGVDQQFESAPSDPQESDKDGLLTGLHAVATELAGLKTSFQREITDQSIQRSSFEKLHREMLDYKENFIQKTMEPLFRQLIGWADHFEEVLNQENVEKDDIGFLYDELIDTLDRYGVEQFKVEGDELNPSMQKVVKTELTRDEALGKTIARRIRPGYRLDGRLIRPEQVVAYKHDANLGVPVGVDTVAEQKDPSGDRNK